ncbi:TetR/AcrR family transcriptional regulator [Nocardioides pocheonensis]|uniref:TetR/AcrR family transcriptional regulator n=1 Tax=Nocardioides pocheonensis TaxID=661485 RepID=A0A3N0GJZ3_9ACTN|nr:TetR/AcrR family transcriptional regulator [Nocardioides pocheonensis]RNM12492.1 TetR/AcrR family transcriptional regulator [Nocardioides pocheonensis]
MSTAYEESGRTRQKQRTRNDLIAAARELISLGGAAPTVEETALAAGVSRTTAYRYFRSQEELLVAAHPEIDLVSLLPTGIGDDPEVRLLSAVRTFLDSTLDAEPQQRTMLRLSLEPTTTPSQLPLRQGRAIGWFEDALAPAKAQLSRAEIHRLAIAVRSAVGIESLVWLVDVAGLSRAEAKKVMLSSARALVRDALSASSGPPRARDRGRSSRGSRAR